MLVRMSLMKDNELYKRDWEIEGLVNFIGKHGLCRLRGRAKKRCMYSTMYLVNVTKNYILLVNQ